MDALVERATASYAACHQVSPACPVSSTTLGYYPNAGLNTFLAVAYGLCAAVALLLGVWKRTWGYMLAVAAGTMLETAGYGARVALHANPWNNSAFETQIVAIILSPTLLCIAVYLTLKHVCVNLNPTLSRIRPALYPYVFVPGDVSCLVVQAIGGGVAASAHKDNIELLQSGNRAIIAGIVLQVVVLLVFGIMAIEYLVCVRRWIRTGTDVTPAVLALWNDRRFRTFLCAISVAYVTILIRCIYRIAEMAGGWGNYIMQDQPSFVVLESFMVLVACAMLAGFPPGMYLPPISGAYRKEHA